MLGISRWSGCLARHSSIVLVAKLSGKALGHAEARRQDEDEQAFVWRLQRQVVPLMPHHHDLTWECMTVKFDAKTNMAWACWDEELMISCPKSKCGNCEHERNPSFEACSCPPCPNALFCTLFHTPGSYLSTHGGVCFNCAVMFEKGNALDFVNSTCVVCYTKNIVCIKHPHCLRSTQHEYCVQCFRVLFWGKGWDVDPKDYGFWLDSPADDSTEQEHAEYDRTFDEWQNTKDGLAYNVELDISEESRRSSQKHHCVKCTTNTTR
jgi:hypothetical protein